MITTRANPQSRWQGTARGMVGLISLLVLCGCSVGWPFDRPIPIGPGRQGLGSDSTAVAVDPSADSTVVVREIPKRPRRIRTRPPESVPDTLTVPVPIDSLLAEPDTVEVEDPAVTISVDRPRDAEERLHQEVVDELKEATALSVAAAREVRTPEDREKIETVRGLIEQAQTALDRGDIQAAANLAHKARLLAEELSTR